MAVAVIQPVALARISGGNAQRSLSAGNTVSFTRNVSGTKFSTGIVAGLRPSRTSAANWPTERPTSR